VKRSSISKAKNSLSALIDLVRHGETVILEDRGIPVAQLGPLTGRAPAADRDRLTRLARQGVIRPMAAAPPSRRLLKAPPRPQRRVALSELVRHEREEGW